MPAIGKLDEPAVLERLARLYGEDVKVRELERKAVTVAVGILGRQ